MTKDTLIMKDAQLRNRNDKEKERTKEERTILEVCRKLEAEINLKRIMDRRSAPAFYSKLSLRNSFGLF